MSEPAKEHRLVLVEWVDSFGCSPNWEAIPTEIDPGQTICRSVGFLVHDGPDALVVVPHHAAAAGQREEQGCGDMCIPLRSVVRVVDLVEAGVEPPAAGEADRQPAPPPEAGRFAAALAEREGDSRLWTAEDALVKTAEEVRSGAWPATALVIVALIDRGDDMRCVQLRIAGPESSREGVTHMLSVAVADHVRECTRG